MKNILIIFGSQKELPNNEKKQNLISMMRGRMGNLKNFINGHNVLSFDLSKKLDEEEQMDLVNAIKDSDELVVFDYELSSPEVLPLIQERLWGLKNVIFFEEKGEEGEEEETLIKKSLGQYEHVKVSAYPHEMIKLMKLDLVA
jgi:hypothetical protein